MIRKIKHFLIGLFLLTLFFGFFSSKAAFADDYQLQGSVKTNSSVAIAGASALILAVPITSVIAAWVASQGTTIKEFIDSF